MKMKREGRGGKKRGFMKQASEASDSTRIPVPREKGKEGRKGRERKEGNEEKKGKGRKGRKGREGREGKGRVSKEGFSSLTYLQRTCPANDPGLLIHTHIV